MFEKNLEDCVDALKHEHIQDPEDEEERELGREECEKPLAGVHVRLQAHLLKVLHKYICRVIFFWTGQPLKCQTSRKLRHLELYDGSFLRAGQLKMTQNF